MGHFRFWLKESLSESCENFSGLKVLKMIFCLMTCVICKMYCFLAYDYFFFFPLLKQLIQKNQRSVIYPKRCRNLDSLVTWWTIKNSTSRTTWICRNPHKVLLGLVTWHLLDDLHPGLIVHIFSSRYKSLIVLRLRRYFISEQLLTTLEISNPYSSVMLSHLWVCS